MIRKLLIWGLFLWLLGVAGRGVYAQDGSRLSYGEILQGRITDDTSRQVYYFEARRGDVVSVQLTAVDGNLDPLLMLADNDGNMLALADDVDGALGAGFSTFQIPEDNFYFIIVTRFGHDLGVTEGDYQLSLAREGVLSEAGVYLSYGDSVVGLIDDETPRAAYIFEARQGDILNVQMQRISGNLDTYVAIASETGQILVANDDLEGSLDARIDSYLILDPGYYQIIASRFGEQAGLSEGSYVLTLDTASTSGLGLTRDAALFLRYGAELDGLVDDEYPVHYYTFGAKRGDIVTASMTRASGDVDPFLTLFNGSGEALIEDDDSGPSNNALIESYIVPESGTYYLLATRFDREAGTTAGDYIVRLEGATGEAPVVASGTLTILYGSTVAGSVTDDSSSANYAFLGNAGDVVTIALTGTSGDLDSFLLLFTADSVQLVQDDDSGPGNDARITAFSLPEDGIYYIVATRFELQNGTTTGNYSLSLVKQAVAQASE
ncbi:PPC domain-containing protein [Chloroflexota bacterium]